MSRWLTFALMMALVSCKKEEAKLVPKLEPPGNELPRAEGEATAAHGPVQVTLRLYKTKIKPQGDYDWKNGESVSLWVQVVLKNVSAKRLAINDNNFYQSGPIPDRGDRPYPPILGTTLELTDASGKRLEPPGGLSDTPFECSPPARDVTPEEKREIDAFLKPWRKKGLSHRQINIKLLDFKSKAGREEPKLVGTWLEPGASTRTTGWADFDPCDVYYYHLPPPKPIGEFSQEKYYFPKPGKYYVRAVYDTLRFESAEDYTREVGFPPDEDRVRFETPAIEFEVLP